MNNRRVGLLFVPLIVFILVFASACATKKFVVQQVADLDKKVEGVSDEVEANQVRLREHDEKLATIGELITQHDSQFKAVDVKIGEVKTLIRGKLISKETLRTGDAKFGFDSFELIPEVKAAVDAFVRNLVEENKGVSLEIQGHTDNVGSEEYNLALGKRRADAVRDYLYRQYHIPLHRMDVISLGSSQPVVDNSTREGRSQNRRVEILVYE